MTENRYGSVVFDGVCSDLSNAAYPVDEVRRSVEPTFEPPWVDAAVHLGLTLLHHGYVVRADNHDPDYDHDREKESCFTLSDEARDAREEGRLVTEVCETVGPRIRGGGADIDTDTEAEAEMAAFVGFVRRVVVSLTGEEEKV